MSSLDQVIEEVILLTENSPFIPPAATSDEIYKKFSDAPHLPPEYEEEGMWYVANCKLDAVFGVQEGSINIRKGPYGLKLVMKWLSEARKHHLWDSETDKARRLIEPAGWDSDSDRLLKVKMENILSYVKALINKKEMECQPPASPGSGVPPSSGSKGKKRPVDSTPDLDSNVSIHQLEKPPAKQSPRVEISLISSDGEEP